MEKSKKDKSNDGEPLEVQLARKQHITSYKLVEEKFKGGQAAPMFTDNSTG